MRFRIRRVVLRSEDEVMTKWVVFEAGSRAGLSAMMFFRHYKKLVPNDDKLLMVDDDKVFLATNNEKYDSVKLICSKALCLEHLGNYTVFPADELTRQRGHKSGAQEWFNCVGQEMYDKRFVTAMLESRGVSVPKTLMADEVIVKPNSMSAGSRGVMNFDCCCVQQRINIAHEYVVDMFVDPDGEIVQLFPREVKLRAGYDRYIRFLYDNHRVAEFARRVVHSDALGMFRGPCHIQVVEDESGKLYYIEGSKRISGTSLVNILKGYNPFMLLTDKVDTIKDHDEDWHSYEELLIKVEELLK